MTFDEKRTVFDLEPSPVSGQSKYSLLEGVYLSWFSEDFYRDVFHHWKGKAFAYLAVLVCLYLAPFIASYYQKSKTVIDTVVPQYLEQLPEFDIKDGRVELIGEKRPYYIKNAASSEQEILFAIDITADDAHAYEFLNDNEEAFGVLTEKKIFFRESPETIKDQSLAEIKELSVRQETVLPWLKETFGWTFALVSILFTFGVLLYRYLIAGVFAVLGLIFKPRTLDITFGEAYRLCLLALTPSLLLEQARAWFGLQVAYWWLINFLVALFYVLFAVRSVLDSAEAPGGVQPIEYQ